jgi:hypothetical protein
MAAPFNLKSEIRISKSETKGQRLKTTGTKPAVVETIFAAKKRRMRKINVRRGLGIYSLCPQCLYLLEELVSDESPHQAGA